MPDKKLTAITNTITAPASNDLLYGVDVSDVSEDPTGTSGKIPISNLLGVFDSAADPNFDAFWGWNDGSGATVGWSIGSGIELSGTTIQVDTTVTATLSGTQTFTNKTHTNPKASYAAFNAGTKTTGTYTPAYSDGNMQYAVNGGAHTLAPQSGNGTICIQYTNNASAGTITTSGFTIVTGDSLTITDGDDFMLFLTVNNGFSHLNVVALQ